MREVVIAASYRSACGRSHKGTLALTRPDELLAQVILGVLERVPQVTPEMIEDVVIGCAMPEGEQGMNIARCSAMLAGLPQEVPAITTNRFCSSGLQAIATAAHQIAFGEMDIALAGGVESMTMVPMGGNKLTASSAIMDKAASVYTPMGVTAENVAVRYEIARADQDEFAYKSQIKAATASRDGKFKDEIIPVKATRYAVKDGKRVRADVIFDTEELPRMETTVEGLAALRPVFSTTGSVTAGNSSPLTDGAAISLVTTKEMAQKLGLEILGYFRGFQAVGVDPEVMGVGPAVCRAQAAQEVQPDAQGHRPRRDERGVRLAVGLLPAQARAPRREGQRQRRRHRPRAPARGHRCEAHGDPAARNEASRCQARHRDHVHWWRHGRGGSVRTPVAPVRFPSSLQPLEKPHGAGSCALRP